MVPPKVRATSCLCKHGTYGAVLSYLQLVASVQISYYNTSTVEKSADPRHVPEAVARRRKIALIIGKSHATSALTLIGSIIACGLCCQHG